MAADSEEELGLWSGLRGRASSAWSRSGPGYGDQRLLDKYRESLDKVAQTIDKIASSAGRLVGGIGGSRNIRNTDGTSSPMSNTGPVGGYSQNPHLDSMLALQMGAQALGNTGLRIGNALQNTQFTGANWQFTANRIARFSGQPMSVAALRGNVNGYQSTEDAMAGTNMLINTMYRNKASFSGVLHGAGGISTLTGMSFASGAGVMSQLGSASVTNAIMARGGGGLIGRNGQIGNSSEAFQSLLRMAITGNAHSNISAGAIRQKIRHGVFNLNNGNAARNARMLGLGDDTIQALTEYGATAGAGGGFLDLNMVGADSKAGRAYRTKYGIQTSSQVFRETQEARTERQSEIFDKTYKSMEKFERGLQSINRSMNIIPGQITSAGFWFGKAAQAAVGLTQAFITARMISTAMRVAAPGAGLATQLGVSGMASGLGLGAGALLPAAGVALAGGGVGYLTKRVLHLRGGAGVLGGAGGGALAGAAIGSLVPVLGTGVGAVVGGLAGALGGMLGDPAGSGSNSISGSSGMSSDLSSRLQQMFADNPRLQLNSGFRTRSQQEALYQRYLNGGPIAAKPGTSQHEKGMAADIGPASEYGWLAANAGRYGLVRTVKSEPWHFEPVGARTQTNLAGAAAADEGSSGGGSLRQTYLGDKYGSVNAASAVSSFFAGGPNRMSPLGGSYGTSGAASGGSGGGGLRSLLAGVGFSGSGLEMAYAIAMAESGGDTSSISKPNKDRWGSVDRGLFQINSHWHSEVGNPLDAQSNAAAAFQISNGGTNWDQWSTYKSGAYKKFMGGVGDPGGGTGGAGFSVNAPRTIHIGQVTVSLQLDGTSPEVAQTIARQVVSILSDNRAVMALANEEGM